MFSDVPVLGLVFATVFSEACALLGAALTVGSWRGNVQADGLVVGVLSCAGALGFGVAAWRAAARMEGKWAGGVVVAATTLLWVITVQLKGGPA
jgi:hypothetical protein